MPVIKSAKKKLRKDKTRTQHNNSIRQQLKSAVKKAGKNPSVEAVRNAIRIADKATKQHIIHKNKAARIKSTLSKLIKIKGIPAAPKKIVKKPVRRQKANPVPI